MNFNNDIPFSIFNFNGNKKEITIIFLFINYLSFKVKAELEEKLIDVINRFKIILKAMNVQKNLKMIYMLLYVMQKELKILIRLYLNYIL